MQKTIVSIWVFFLSAIIIYVGLSYILIQTPNNTISNLFPLYAVIGILSLVCAVISVVLRLKLINHAIASGTLLPNTEEGTKKIHTYLIIIWAITESIAIYGLILAILAGKFLLCLPCAIVSFAIMIYQHPFIEDKG